MIYFDSDYLEGCHESIIREIEKSNKVQYYGYGEDYYTKESEKIAAKLTGCDCNFHLLSGGTQTNMIFIKHALRAHEAVISADTGHIFVNETQAIESSGHKVIAVKSDDGKIVEESLISYLENTENDTHKIHKPKPAMLYISNPTETGSIYSKKELLRLRDICDRYNLYLYLDGARLGYLNATEENDLSIKDLYKITDAFYIGLTKCGAMFGEALLIRNEKLNEDFLYTKKQNGALLAKGRFLGIQFKCLFEDDLYTKICREAIIHAKNIARVFIDSGFNVKTSPTNQQFVTLTHDQYERFSENFSFDIWDRNEQNITIRICTSWATTIEHVNKLIEFVRGF